MKITQETTRTTTPQIESRTTTRDEVLAMVEQTCGSTKISAGNIYYTFTAGQLERFAALVAAAEREECAKDKVDAERWRMAKSLAVVRKSGRKLYKTDDPIPSYRLLKDANFGVIKPEINEEYEVCLFACIGETSIPEMDAMMDNAIDRARSTK